MAVDGLMEWPMAWVESLGDANFMVLAGLVTGLLFGVFAQQSRFCLRSASMEFWRGEAGQKFAIWLLAFSAALFLTQAQMLAGTLPASGIRQLNGTGSLSGAIAGGALFGVGMILARGCASRLLVLSGTGNLRALLTGLLLTVAAQASLRGFLSPLREEISSWWTVSGNARNLAAYMPQASGIVLAILLFAVAIWLTRRSGLRPWPAITGFLVGATIAFGWWVTAWHASWTFDVPAIQSVTFTGPSADTLMALINQPDLPRNFGIGLVPGVFAGALVASLATREFEVQTFNASTGMVRYLIGAVLMGFGGMLAGGCAVGAGVTGGAVLAVTAWVALFSMWISAGLADLFLSRMMPVGGTAGTAS